MSDQREPAKKQQRLTDLWSGASKATVDSGGDHCVETEYGSAPSAVPVQLPLPVQPCTSTTSSTQPTEVGQKPCSSSSSSCPSVTAAHNDIDIVAATAGLHLQLSKIAQEDNLPMTVTIRRPRRE